MSSKIVLTKKAPNIVRSFCTQGGTWTRTGITTHWILSPACLPIPPLKQIFWYRAKNGVRTRDLDLGKVALYQLSYFRVSYFSFF